MLFAELSEIVRAVLCTWTAVILLIDAYVFFRYTQRERSGRRPFILVTLFLSGYILLQMQKSLICGLADMRYRGALYHWMLNIPALPVLVLLLLLSGMAFWLHYETIIWRRHHIVSMDIKEGTDALPIGLLYYWDDGVIKLCNSEMQGIIWNMYGQQPQDGQQFWRELQNGGNTGKSRLIRRGAEPIVGIGRDDIYSFRHRELMMEEEVLHELLATNVRAEYHLSQLLEEQNNKLYEMNQRLRRLGEMISEVTAERETLEAKVRIHNETGSTMLATRHYLENGDSEEKLGELLKMWDSIGMLMHSQPEEEEDDTANYLKDIREAAAAVGIQLYVEGSVDRKNKLLVRMLTAGARECLTNAYRHAQAGRLNVSVKKDPVHEDGFVIEYTNDGVLPQGPVREGGGLSSLRRTVESEGGKLEILTSPEFMLRISYPAVP